MSDQLGIIEAKIDLPMLAAMLAIVGYSLNDYEELFIEKLDTALKQASNRNGQVGLLYIDLDRFKEINDTLGHGAGDELLRVIAERFLEHLRTNYPSRLRGPEPASVARRPVPR